jgi:predicted dehydrogenase
MGKCHALAYGAVTAVFGDVARPRLELLCETPADKARTLAAQFGFARATDDWRALVADPAVDIVCITTPNKLHREIALAALAAGKHVHCEKPMALTLDEARDMRDAAAARPGQRTIVGYNYIRNPAFAHAVRLVAGGAIGRIVHFRGFVDEDYQADPDLPWSWRATLAEAGLGALGDLCCHLISLAVQVCGPVDSVSGDIRTVHATRPVPGGAERRPVENDDIATALVRFAGGVSGVIGASRSAWGRKSHIGFEVHGTTGMIRYDQERMNELQLYVNEGDPATQGFRTILTGPAHPPYGEYCPAPGHQLGFNDLKVMEVRELLLAIAGGRAAYPSFDDAWGIEQVIHAVARSSAAGGTWVKPAEL